MPFCVLAHATSRHSANGRQKAFDWYTSIGRAWRLSSLRIKIDLPPEDIRSVKNTTNICNNVLLHISVTTGYCPLPILALQWPNISHN